MGNKSRDKGARFERQLVNTLQGCGIAAERIPLSGQAGGSFAGDVSVPYLQRDHRFEAKIRANGFRELYGWIESNQGLFLRADRESPLAVLRMRDFCDLILAAERSRVERGNNDGS